MGAPFPSVRLFRVPPIAAAWRPHALVLVLVLLPVLAEIGVHNGTSQRASAAVPGVVGGRPAIAPGRTANLTQVSPDGRIAAITLTQRGDAAAAPHVILMELPSGRMLDDLQRFTIRHDGTELEATGATIRDLSFARDSNLFYASLDTAGRTFRVRGDIRRRELVVVD